MQHKSGMNDKSHELDAGKMNEGNLFSVSNLVNSTWCVKIHILMMVQPNSYPTLQVKDSNMYQGLILWSTIP